MDVFIKLLMCVSVMLTCRCATAQTDTIYLSTAQAENLFIKQNLELIAERLNIDIADAAIMQAKLWTNPTLSIEDVNLWNTDKMRDEMGDIFPDASFARNKKFAVGIEQVIITGGKRRKLVEMEKVSRDIAVQYFEELLRSLKVELRNACAETLFVQEYRKVLEKQQASLDALIGNYRRQVEQGNVSRSEYIRLQAELFGVRSEINELQRDMNQQQKDLKMLLNISTPSHIVLTATIVNTKSPEELPYGNLFELAEASRPDLKEAMFQKDFSEKSLRYEKAQRTSDLALSAMYDRAGGVGRNFVGFGVSMDLPFFDRNQGNIRAAQISITQSQTLLEQKQLEVRNEVIHAVQNYTLAYDFNRQITGEFISELDEMQESYTRNFINKNIGIVEFLDFFEAWKENKRTALEAQKDLKISFEELQYAVGTDLLGF
jgi:cobalt-zinc-cadmium efflux system outer membrane protein